MSQLPPLPPTSEPSSNFDFDSTDSPTNSIASKLSAFTNKKRLKKFAPLIGAGGVALVAMFSLVGLYVFQKNSTDNRPKAGGGPIISNIRLSGGRSVTGDAEYVVTLDNTAQLPGTRYVSITTEVDVTTPRPAPSTTSVLGVTDEAEDKQLAQVGTTSSPVPTTTVRCWNQVLRINKVYYWPNSCRGYTGGSVGLICVQSLIKLKANEITSYQNWVANGRRVPAACRPASPIPSPSVRPTPSPSIKPSTLPTPSPSTNPSPSPSPDTRFVLAQNEQMVVYAQQVTLSMFDSYLVELNPVEGGTRISFQAQVVNRNDPTIQQLLEGQPTLFTIEYRQAPTDQSAYIVSKSVKGYSPWFPTVLMELTNPLDQPVTPPNPSTMPSPSSSPQTSFSPQPSASVAATFRPMPSASP